MATAQDIFNRILPRLAKEPPSQDFLTTVQHVVSSLDKRLSFHKSDLLRAESTTTNAQSDNSVTLPTGMIALWQKPVLSYIPTGASTKSFKTLEPLPEDKRFTFVDEGIPEFFDVKGATLYLYPTPEQSVDVNLITMNKNTVSAISSAIPYNGLFDDFIAEAVIKYASNPLLAASDKALDYMASMEVDRVINFRHPKKASWLYSL